MTDRQTREVIIRVAKAERSRTNSQKTELLVDTQRGWSRGVLVANAANFEGPKVPNFMEKPPFLSEKLVHNFEIFGKTHLSLFAQ